jgi:hypothetical protein
MRFADGAAMHATLGISNRRLVGAAGFTRNYYLSHQRSAARNHFFGFLRLASRNNATPMRAISKAPYSKICINLMPCGIVATFDPQYAARLCAKSRRAPKGPWLQFRCGGERSPRRIPGFPASVVLANHRDRFIRARNTLRDGKILDVG